MADLLLVNPPYMLPANQGLPLDFVMRSLGYACRPLGIGACQGLDHGRPCDERDEHEYVKT